MIYITGIGPGNKDEITPRAFHALEKCDFILGYKKYIDLIQKFFPEKNFISFSMRQERKRCEEALKLSVENKTVGLISSGDPGIYGMAGLMLEISNDKTEIEIIPGITAASSAAAILGAPLMNDFAVISLSDLMTPWNLIEKRLISASNGDFIICIYNPSSKNRPEHFKKACEILLKYKSPETPSGFVRNAGRNQESHGIMTLNEIKNLELDMFCTVIIGNSFSRIKNGKLITLRGY